MSFDPDEIYNQNDDDIFSSPTSSATSSSSSSQRPQLPGYLSAALSRYVKEHPEFLNSFGNFKKETDYSVFIATASIFERILIKIYPKKSQGPLIRSILSVLDEITEGAVQRRFQAYQFEPLLLSLHINLLIINGTHQAILDAPNAPTKLSNQILEHLRTLSEAYVYSINYLSEQYIEACDLANIPYDENLIKFGIKTESDFSFACSIDTSQVLAHYQYGDITDLSNLYEASTREAFIKHFTNIVFFAPSETVELSVSI
jgi:hypothetical protein